MLEALWQASMEAKQPPMPSHKLPCLPLVHRFGAAVLSQPCPNVLQKYQQKQEIIYAIGIVINQFQDDLVDLRIWV